MHDLPIGVFDSGIGGLTVLRELARLFPAESFLYLGDTARLPYGTKSPETIRAYSEQVMNFLVKKGVKALAIACNSASSQVKENQWKDRPLYSVIRPGAEAAAKITQTFRVGVLGTRATIESRTYVNELISIDPTIEVFGEPCPLFVPLAEEGWIDDPITDLVVKRYLSPLIRHQVDTIVLGCTHYPLLRSAIEKFTGPKIQIVDSGLALARRMHKDMERNILTRSKRKSRTLTIMTTDYSEHMEKWARKILADFTVDSFQKVNLTLGD